MIYVYYHYDAFELGGHGMEEFETIKDAEKRIAQRMRYRKHSGEYPKPDEFTVIRGEKLKIKIVEQVQQVSLK